MAKLLSLLSGGFDSVVASYFLMQKGHEMDFVLFHDSRFVPEKEKKIAIDAGRKICINKKKALLYIVKDGEFLSEIANKCERRLYTVLYRRFMVRTAKHIPSYSALVTGDNFGQVASQTMENIMRVNEAAQLPILRPLLCFSKNQIIEIAKQIGTYEISKGHKCCGITPSYPRTKANKEEVEREESKLNMQGLIENAHNNIKKLSMS